MIDFTPLKEGQMKAIEFATQFTLDDLRAATNESIDLLRSLIEDLTDAHVTFDPVDPDAHDPYAVEGEEKIGWSLAHLVVHVTASSEEGAAYSSFLARGIPLEQRPRYEVPWRTVTTVAQCLQRLEESRRMRLAYLDTWPDEPHLDVYRKVSERFLERYGESNAASAFVFGLMHEVGHYGQFREVRRQALEALPVAAAK